MQELASAVEQAAKKLFKAEVSVNLERPEEKFGDYATNVALRLAAQSGLPPRQVAERLAAELQDAPGIKEVGIAGPGFINFILDEATLSSMAASATKLPKSLTGHEILVEFGDPNPFKEMHIGHLYALITGDGIANLLEAAGATVRRLSYHGDVGLHVAKAIWGMQQEITEISKAYAAGAKAYEEETGAKAEIQAINEHIYRRDNEAINNLYARGRAQSLEGFDAIYKTLGINYDKHYFESQSMPEGLKFVQEHPKVFKSSEGAIVYEGEKAGLHTRVFVTSRGLPTYETKDLGLAELKNKDYPKASRSIIVTANEQAEYFKVMLAALTEIDGQLAQKTTHLSHGFVNLSTGKMSSRTGDIYAAADLLSEVKKATHEQYPDSEIHKEVGIGAVKYSFSRHRIGPDIVFDIKESVGLEGNSGPYLQYTYARACSVLAKSSKKPAAVSDLEPEERVLVRKISEYPEVVAKATSELMPHYICIYLYELAQSFNRFYEKNRVIDDPREAERLSLVEYYAEVLKSGLSVLGIAAPERM